ncbi:hypothetical protein BS47DRAFT_1057485 [Hydnum rufescens UP504]|uniref:Uncharacterized protein n=1 Tax=Hydnum rufescens UP504 TaxID=1448309 RepID=A0A9P6DW72_9AGAM|nr:hypothetical protein BS47DRAFT_1057485 [Hydnum rufescens UP504]
MRRLPGNDLMSRSGKIQFRRPGQTDAQLWCHIQFPLTWSFSVKPFVTTMAHNSLRPTLPSIHALFGLGDRDQLGTILDKPSKSPPPGEHRQASFPDRRTFFYARDEATVPIERSPHNNRDYHSNSPGSNGPRYTSGDLAYHESESLSIPSSRVIQPDSFITPSPQDPMEP